MNTAPYLHIAPSTTRIMYSVILALCPAILLLVFFEGTRWFAQLALAVLTATVAEVLILRLRQKAQYWRIATDGSAQLTAVLLALALPLTAPYWLVISATLFAIIIVKQLYGGIGMNIFNPAMAGYAFALMSFPALMAQHPANWQGISSLWQDIDATTAATPLDLLRNGTNKHITLSLHIWIINISWILGALWLAYKRYLDWRLLVSTLLAACIAAWFEYKLNANSPTVLIQLLTGSTIFTACFIATDPVTAATTKLGRWIYGALIGALLILIRAHSNYPDGAAFAVLFANALVPLIDPLTQPRYR